MIEVKNLTKCYGKHTAVDNISFMVNDGEIIGFLGPNGAGKTTTMNILTGYISSTDGDVLIAGYNILDEPEKAKANIGYLPDTPPVYGDMKVIEYLKFVADIKKVKPFEKKDMIENIMVKVSIQDMSHRLIKNLSKGYRQRVGLAQAMVGNPKVLILDEPTVGLDPKQIIEMRQVIKDLGKSHTIILSSHILSEVSAVCDRVMIINKGQIVASDTTQNLTLDLNKNNKIIVRIKGSKTDAEKAFDECSVINNVTFQGCKEEYTNDFLLESYEENDIREAVYNVSVSADIVILTMKPYDLTLEEIFLQITETNVIKDMGIDSDNIADIGCASGGDNTGETHKAQDEEHKTKADIIQNKDALGEMGQIQNKDSFEIDKSVDGSKGDE